MITLSLCDRSGHGIDWLDGLVDWLTDTVESVGDNSRCTVGISTLLGRYASDMVVKFNVNPLHYNASEYCMASACPDSLKTFF